MSSDKDREFESNMNQLVHLLKKILKHLPGQSPFSQFKAKPGEGLNLNVCFFNFLPLSPEEFEAFQDACEHEILHEDWNEEFTRELSVSDIEFLRRNGIRF